MSGSSMLLAANVAVWSGIMLYVLSLARRYVRLEKRMRQLEISCERDDQAQ
ncbi:MAG: CcmD family protein [Desulfovermiculus sp.]|nr:CcmD family protein [Desulfovermiculus sp.]